MADHMPAGNELSRAAQTIAKTEEGPQVPHAIDPEKIVNPENIKLGVPRGIDVGTDRDAPEPKGPNVMEAPSKREGHEFSGAPYNLAYKMRHQGKG
jgi:hypothetical protein